MRRASFSTSTKSSQRAIAQIHRAEPEPRPGARLSRLTEPDAVAAFVKDHAELSNSQTAERVQDRSRLEAERAAIRRKLEGKFKA